MSDSNEMGRTPELDEYSKEPVGGGAETVPDASGPQTPKHDIEGDDEMGGDDTVAANDELDGDVER